MDLPGKYKILFVLILKYVESTEIKKIPQHMSQEDNQ